MAIPLVAHIDSICRLPRCDRPRYSRNGFVHDYCGREHASAAMRSGLITTLADPKGSCHQCSLPGCTRTVAFDKQSGRVHDFCCASHARTRKQQVERAPIVAPTNPPPVCVLPSCSAPVCSNALTGKMYNYCSRSHARLHKRCRDQSCDNTVWDLNGNFCSSKCAIAMCGKQSVSPLPCSLPGCHQNALLGSDGKSLDFCKAEHRNRAKDRGLVGFHNPNIIQVFGGKKLGFMLQLLTKTFPDYSSIKGQFRNQFVKGPPPTVERIFRIVAGKGVYAKYEQFKSNMQALRGDPNIVRRFHGTRGGSECRFFADLSGAPCGQRDCSICGICREGFNMTKSGRTAQRSSISLRYGKGHYFSSVSGKAHDYATDITTTKKTFRMVFMCNIVAGKVYKAKTTSMVEPLPPVGYDAVVGDTKSGLNYDELVVYSDDACLPTYILSYSY